MRALFFGFLLFVCWCSAQESVFQGGPERDVLDDLLLAHELEENKSDTLPRLRTTLSQLGYVHTPSARMDESGVFGFGYSYYRPYNTYSVFAQIFPFFEASGTYRILSGFDDPVMGAYGFGSYADKGANFRLSLTQGKEISFLPELAVGMHDFHGSRLYETRYIVGTKSFPRWNTEVSLGYGTKHYNGMFWGAAWTPWRRARWQHSGLSFLNALSLVAEHDPTDYEADFHPGNRTVSSRFNYGLQYARGDYLRLMVAKTKGSDISFAGSLLYPFANPDAARMKFADPLPYRAPRNREPIGQYRGKRQFAHELAYAFEEQEISLYDVAVEDLADGKKRLYLSVDTIVWAEEAHARRRINAVLSALMPSNIDEIYVTVEHSGLEVHQFRYRRQDLLALEQHALSQRYWEELLPAHETIVHPKEAERIFKYYHSPFMPQFDIVSRTSFGASTSKVKVVYGVALGTEGLLFGDLYYRVLCEKINAHAFSDVDTFDVINPSQMIQVRTDQIAYDRATGVHLVEGFFQRSWNLSRAFRGLYGRVALGYFEMAYGGIAAELLIHRAASPLAFGIEGARLLKRDYGGIEFTHRIKRLVGTSPVWEDFEPRQYFANLYYDCGALGTEFSFKYGRFLAKDRGLKTTISRYFPTGVTLYAWLTVTNGGDRVNGSTYHDKGAGFSIPFDFFLTKSSRMSFKQEVAAWLRDVGAVSQTGISLHEMISAERVGRSSSCRCSPHAFSAR